MEANPNQNAFPDVKESKGSIITSFFGEE